MGFNSAFKGLIELMNAYFKIRSRFRRKKIARQAEKCIQYTDFYLSDFCVETGKTGGRGLQCINNKSLSAQTREHIQE